MSGFKFNTNDSDISAESGNVTINGNLPQENDAILDDIAGLTFTKGDVLVYNGTNLVNLAVGTNGQVIEADSATGTGIKWATPSGGGTPAGADTEIQYNNSGVFGASSFFTWDNTNSALMIDSGAGDDTAIELLEDGTNKVRIFWDASAATVKYRTNQTGAIVRFEEGNGLSVMMEMDPAGAVTQRYNGTSVARTAAAASGGLEVNNLLTGAGFERALTIGDLSTNLTAGAGLTGGGDLTANRTFDVGAGTGITVNANDVALDTANLRNVDHSAVSISAGTGLTGGGTIAANRTLSLSAGINLLSDVTITAAGTGDTLFKSAGDWVNGSMLRQGFTGGNGAAMKFQAAAAATDGATIHIGDATGRIFLGDAGNTSDINFTFGNWNPSYGTFSTILSEIGHFGTNVLQIRSGSAAGNGRVDIVSSSGSTTMASFVSGTGGAVTMYHNNVSMARTAIAGSGGFEVNNTVTGAGFERALTTSDLTSLSNLNSLSDVVIAAAATGDVLRYNGTNWVDYPDSNFASSALTLTAGNGLTGGGDLTASRTFDVGAGDGISVAADSVAVDSTVIRTTGTQTLGGQKTFSSPVYGPAGSAAAPSFAFSGDTNTGMFSRGVDDIGWSCNGVEVLFLLDNGDLEADGDMIAFSDIRGKENIQPIFNALEKVNQIGGYTFEKKNSPGRRYTGVIAQEVEEVLPEAVHQNREDGLRGVAYGNMVGLLIEAVKELTQKVELLESELKSYKQ